MIIIYNKKRKLTMYQKTKKRKIIHDEIVLVKKKNENLTECIAFLDSDIATEYSIEAEANRDFTLLTKAVLLSNLSSSFRKTKMEKEKSIKALHVALGKLENGIKALGE